jgi:uncharacterized protein YpmS
MEKIQLEKRENIKQIVFLVLIAILILVLIFTVVTLIKNKDLISKNGISYEIVKQNFSYCQCMSERGLVLFDK